MREIGYLQRFDLETYRKVLSVIEKGNSTSQRQDYENNRKALIEQNFLDCIENLSLLDDMKNPKEKKSLIPKQDLIEKMKLKKEEIRFKIK